MEKSGEDFATADGSVCVLHRQFEKQAAKTPRAPALIHDGRTIAFDELNAAASRVAAALRRRGLPAGSAVGLHLERSISYYVAMLGILKAACAVVPLPPSYPEGRLRDIFAFSGLDAVVDDIQTPLDLTPGSALLHFEDLEREPGELGAGRECMPDQPAFVLCSSGSTGQPKMIVRSHRSFFHRLNWTWENWPYLQGEVCCQKAHMTTTHSIYELFEPLLRGVPVHILPDETVRDLERFWETIRDLGVSRLLIVPSVLQASLDMPGFTAPPVRVLVLMGEYLHPRLAGRALEAFPADTRIFSIYGSTESSSTLVCDVRESYRPGEELPLGRPISPEVCAYVLGPALEEAGAGESGLLHMAGPALFTEYFRNPVLTESVFVRSTSGLRLFNTHDQVRRLADGSIQFVGRIDHTVKIRGFRVDLGEVEWEILQQPGIRQTAVMPGGPFSENPPLIAFYGPASADQAAVLGALRDRLPAYMVPSVLIGIDSFPLRPSGKIDRRKLLESYLERPSRSAADEDLSSTEARIVEVWRDVLRHGEISRGSSFFDTGGTSLSVFTAVHRLRDAFGLERHRLSDHSIYQHPTVSGLATYIDGMLRGETPAAATRSTVAVTLRQGDAAKPPIFVIASSGGTLGAYEKLSKVLRTSREIVGIRDPFVWGGRDPTRGFQHWIDLYLAAMQERQPEGPYTVCAFSSAGAFGYEIARRLRQEGHEVAPLVLIDPIGIAGEAQDDFGFKVFKALFAGGRRKLLARVEGWWRLITASGGKDDPGGNDYTMSAEELEERSSVARGDRKIMMDLSSLFELNTGLPFTMTDADFSGLDPAQYLSAFLSRVRQVSPDVEPETVERILIQYYCLQLPATHFYRLGRYDGRVEIFEPEGPNVGLLAAYFRLNVRDLGLHVLEIGEPSARTREVCENLSRSLRIHYRSMRDDTFVTNLAVRLGPLLK